MTGVPEPGQVATGPGGTELLPQTSPDAARQAQFPPPGPTQPGYPPIAHAPPAPLPGQPGAGWGPPPGHPQAVHGQAPAYGRPHGGPQPAQPWPPGALPPTAAATARSPAKRGIWIAILGGLAGLLGVGIGIAWMGSRTKAVDELAASATAAPAVEITSEVAADTNTGAATEAPTAQPPIAAEAPAIQEPPAAVPTPVATPKKSTSSAAKPAASASTTPSVAATASSAPAGSASTPAANDKTAPTASTPPAANDSTARTSAQSRRQKRPKRK